MTKTQNTEYFVLDDLEKQPLIVEAHHESVVIVGPQGCSLALTPKAALASADILIEAAAAAHDL